MGRRVKELSDPVSGDRGPNGGPAHVCFLCGESDHEIATLGADKAELVFLIDLSQNTDSTDPLAPLFMSSPEGQLFEKIRDAMRLSQNQTSLWIRRESGAGVPRSVCAALQLKELKQGGAKVLIAFGEGVGRSVLGSSQSLSEMRGRIHDRYDLRIAVTESLSSMLANPNLKKKVWEELKLGLKGLKD